MIESGPHVHENGPVTLNTQEVEAQQKALKQKKVSVLTVMILIRCVIS